MKSVIDFYLFLIFYELINVIPTLFAVKVSKQRKTTITNSDSDGDFMGKYMYVVGCKWTKVLLCSMDLLLKCQLYAILYKQEIA